MESTLTPHQVFIIRMLLMQRKNYRFIFPYYYLRHGKNVFVSVDTSKVSGIYDGKFQRIAECVGGGFIISSSREGFNFFRLVDEIVHPVGTSQVYNSRGKVLAALSQYLDSYHERYRNPD